MEETDVPKVEEKKTKLCTKVTTLDGDGRPSGDR